MLNRQDNNIIIQPTPNTTTPSTFEKHKRHKLFTKLFCRKKSIVFVWYFRPVRTSTWRSSGWKEFERKNQLELSRQWNLSRNPELVLPTSFQIQDKHIFKNKVIITVMLKEKIAFVLDPEWSKPITYEITCEPKLNWYKAICMKFAY